MCMCDVTFLLDVYILQSLLLVSVVYVYFM